MNKLFFSRAKQGLRTVGVLLLSLVLLASTATPIMAKEKEIEITYFYSFIHSEPLITTVDREDTFFTIYDELGGCGPIHRDTALVEVGNNGKVRAYYHDCLTGDGVGTFGPWVKKGCSTAEEFGYIVKVCILDNKHN